MNFKEAFDNDCNKITASDELINRTLMAAITQEDSSDGGNGSLSDNPAHKDLDKQAMDGGLQNDINQSSISMAGKQSYKSALNSGLQDKSAQRNSSTIAKSSHKAGSRRNIFRILAAAAAIILLCFSVYSVRNFIDSKNSSSGTSTLKVYAGENNEELGPKGLSLAYCKDTADHMTDIQGWSSQGWGPSHTRVLFFDLNIQITDNSSNIKRVTLTSSDENTNILTREAVPDEIADNDYKIPDEYGEQHSLYKYSEEWGYHTYRLFNSNEKFLYLDHQNEYCADYKDFEHLYIGFKLANVNSLCTTLTITVEYEDGTTVSRNYNATAYSSELYMFIKEIK